MIFFNEDGVVQTHAVVVTATAAHGVLLGASQAREGFAGVQDPRLRALHGIGVLAGGDDLVQRGERSLASVWGAGCEGGPARLVPEGDAGIVVLVAGQTVVTDAINESLSMDNSFVLFCGMTRS